MKGKRSNNSCPFLSISPCDRALLVGRRHAVAKAMSPTLIRGNTGNGRAKTVDDADPFLETEAKAQQVGHRTIGRYRAIYLSLGENYLLRLRGTSLDTVVQLETISRLPRDDRRPIHRETDKAAEVQT